MRGAVAGLNLAVPTVFDAALIAPAAGTSGELASGIRAEAAADPGLPGLLRQAAAARAELLAGAAALAGSGYEPKGFLIEKLGWYTRTASKLAPFVAGGRVVVECLHEAAAGRGLDPAELARLAGWPDSPAAQEIRSLYELALAASREPAARDLILDLSANRAYRRLEAEHPALHEMAARHLERYGWVRTVGGLGPLTPKELLQRVQVALLRWDAGTIARAAGEGAAPPDPGEHHDLVAAYRTATGDVAFGPQVLVMARWLARPFFDATAAALEVEPPALTLATPQEISRALGGEAPLPAEELAARAGGFTVSGAGGRVTVTAGGPAAGELSGQSVSLGRAAGRVKVVLDADEGGKLEPGDILVTGLSTPNYEGQPSVFPYRTVPAVAVERAAGVITDEGGLLSHAAIICRESQVPSILGTERATEVLRDGMIVEVDATRAAGVVTILEGENLRSEP